MNGRPRANVLRPASWSFATKATLVPSVGLVLVSIVLALLVNQAIRDIQLESVQADFELLGQAQSRRVAQAIVREVSLLNALAQSGVVVEHAKEHQVSAMRDESLPSDEHGNPEVRAEIDLFLRRFPQFDVVRIVDAQGTLIASSADEEAVHSDFSDEEWLPFVVSLTAGRLYLSDEEMTMGEAEADSTEAQGVEIALPILDEIDQPIGAVYAVWDVASATEVTSGVRSGRVIVLQGDGLVLADSAENTLGMAVLDSAANDAFEANLSGSALWPDEYGIDTVFGYASLVGLTQLPEFQQTEAFEFDVAAPIRALGWTVVVGQEAEEALAATELLSQRVLILLGLSTLFIIGVVFLFARTLIAPLSRLTEAARNVGAGQLDTPIPQLGGDEIGELADVLRGTVSQLVERVEQLRAATEVTQVAQTKLEFDALLQGVTDAIHQRFGVAQACIFLLGPDGDQLALSAASGRGVERLYTDLPSVPLNAQNVIASALVFSNPQVSRDGDTVLDGGSELAVPLEVGGEQLGVLCVASPETDAFGAEVVSVMALLADQVSASLQNARLFEQRESNLRYIEALNRRLTREGWGDTMAQQGELRLVPDSVAGEKVWPESLNVVAAQGETVVSDEDDDQAVLGVPITLRGEVIGTLGVRRPAGHQWSEDEVALVQAVGERVALIAEDIRLLDEADRTAVREQKVSAVSERLQRATQMDTLLRVALSELGGALGTENVSLRIGSPPGQGGDASHEEGADGQPD